MVSGEDTVTLSISTTDESLFQLLEGIPSDSVNVRRESMGIANIDTPVELIVTALAASPVLIQLIRSLEAVLKENRIKRLEVTRKGELKLEGASKDAILQILETLNTQKGSKQ